MAAISGGGFVFDKDINNIKEMVVTSLPLVPPSARHYLGPYFLGGSNTKGEILGRRVHTDVRSSVFTLRPMSCQITASNNVLRVANEKYTY